MLLDTRELFARMIRCEAEGEGDAGMRAVAQVVMNRVHVPYGEYLRVCQVTSPGPRADVSSCYKSVIAGVPNTQNVWSRPGSIHYKIADWAIQGGVFSGVGTDALWYMNPFSQVCPDPFPITAADTGLRAYASTAFIIPQIYMHKHN